jgi:hypothetical protein
MKESQIDLDGVRLPRKLDKELERWRKKMEREKAAARLRINITS